MSRRNWVLSSFYFLGKGLDKTIPGLGHFRFSEFSLVSILKCLLNNGLLLFTTNTPIPELSFMTVLNVIPVFHWPEEFQVLTQNPTFSITLFLMRLQQSIAIYSVEHGIVNCFHKEPYSKYFHLCGPYRFWYKDLILLSQKESNRRKCLNEQAWLCSSKTLFTKIRGRSDLTHGLQFTQKPQLANFRFTQR